MKASRLAEYQKRLNKLKAEKAQFWKPQEGINLIRILPPISENQDFFHETKSHFITGAGENGGKAACACLGNKCPICIALKEIEKDPELDVMGHANDAKPVSQYFMNIIDMKTPEAGVQVYRLTAKSIIEQLLEHLVDPEWGEFFGVKSGNTVKITMEKKGSRTTYTTSLKPKTTSIDSSYLSQRKDLTKMGNTPDVAEARKYAEFLTGKKSFTDEDEEEDYEQTVSRKKKALKKKKKMIKKKKKRNPTLSFKF